MNYIAVVEDSAQDRAVLDSYLEKYQQEKNCHFQITHFSDGDEIALGYKGGYDLILMDIEMTFMDGMSAAEEIRRADPEVLIIFITNSPQYAIKGYAVQALDYILKPLSYYAFCQRMNHVRELLGRRQKHFLTVPCAGGVQKLDASNIYYVEICDHDLLFHTKQGKVHSTGSMRDVGRSCRRRISSAAARRTLSIWSTLTASRTRTPSSTVSGCRSAAPSARHFWRRSITTWGKHLMETEVLGNIPRLYTALADWLACLLYLYFLPKRTAGWRRYTIHAVFLLLLGVFMQATGRCRNSGFCPALRYPS